MRARHVEASLVGRSVHRVDGVEKVDGSIKFPTDAYLEGMLYAKVLRSPHPHARIVSMDTSEAERHPGVEAVITRKDIPGLNRYGALQPDIPVLAEDVVRYVGEPVAIIVAVDEETAEEAMGLVRVEYEPLKPVLSIEEALGPGSPRVRPGGNIARHSRIVKGNPREMMEKADVVVENVYKTQFQKHMYIEVEGGVAWIDEKGVLNVFAGGQSPYRDKLQISRVLNIPMDKIRVVSYPVGGAFGGKDDVTVQIHLALSAWKTKKPVRLVWSREESGAAGYHRHSYKIEMKTGARRDGRLLANVAKIYSDNGAYLSFGPAVLDVTMEVINGPYRVPSYEIDAYLVYTNNGVSSAMRGFGAPEANFAMESQMNILAEKLGMDKLEIRRVNLLEPGEEGPFGTPLTDKPVLQEMLSRARRSSLLSGGAGSTTSRPWVRRGVGVSLGLKGVGLGTIPEYVAAVVEIDHERKRVRAGFSNVDYGQGVVTSNAQIVADTLQIPIELVEVVNADSSFTPDTGASSASRTTYVAGNALRLACLRALETLALEAARVLHTTRDNVEYEGGFYRLKNDGGRVSLFDVAKSVEARGLKPRFEAFFDVPRYPKPVEGTLEVPHMVYSFALVIAEVEVDTLTGQTRLREVEIYPDIGRVLNPLGAESQMEGGIIQGAGMALIEELRYLGGKPQNINFTTYITPTINDAPDRIKTEFIVLGEGERTGPFGAKGAGEIPIVPIAAAIADAIADATGVRVNELPANGERVLKALAAGGRLPPVITRLILGSRDE